MLDDVPGGVAVRVPDESRTFVDPCARSEDKGITVQQMVADIETGKTVPNQHEFPSAPILKDAMVTAKKPVSRNVGKSPAVVKAQEEAADEVGASSQSSTPQRTYCC